MAKKVRIKDIATKSELSNTLVSLVLNGKAAKYGIKPETQQKVLFVAKEMGYFDNLHEGVQNKINPPSKIIGMIVTGLKDQFLYEITPLLNRAFSSIGYSFSVITKDDDSCRFDLIIENLKKFYSGFILYGESADDNLVHNLRSSAFPFIVLEKKEMKRGVNIINTDLDKANELVAEHVSGLGYKKIFIIGNADTESYLLPLKNSLRDRIPGLFIADLILMDDALINSTDSEKILKMIRPPEAKELIIIMESKLVYPLYKLLRLKGIRIPGDLALISLDEGIGFELMDPAVTCIRRKYTSIALKLTQTLWTEIKNNGISKYKRYVNLPPELVVRKSCGAF